MRGRSAIFDYWAHVTETERNIQFEHEILGVTDQAGPISYCPTGAAD